MLLGAVVTLQFWRCFCRRYSGATLPEYRIYHCISIPVGCTWSNCFTPHTCIPVSQDCVFLCMRVCDRVCTFVCVRVMASIAAWTQPTYMCETYVLRVSDWCWENYAKHYIRGSCAHNIPERFHVVPQVESGVYLKIMLHLMWQCARFVASRCTSKQQADVV